MAVPEGISNVFTLALHSQNVTTERNSAVTAKADSLEHVRVVEETAAELLASWTLKKMNRAGKCDKARPAMQRLIMGLMALLEQCFAHKTGQSELFHALDAFS